LESRSSWKDTEVFRAQQRRVFLAHLDLDANGQMVWKLSPDAGRTQLAETAGRSG